jgi:hypothetical protein
LSCVEKYLEANWGLFDHRQCPLKRQKFRGEIQFLGTCMMIHTRIRMKVKRESDGKLNTWYVQEFSFHWISYVLAVALSMTGAYLRHHLKSLSCAIGKMVNITKPKKILSERLVRRSWSEISQINPIVQTVAESQRKMMNWPCRKGHWH